MNRSYGNMYQDRMKTNRTGCMTNNMHHHGTVMNRVNCTENESVRCNDACMTSEPNHCSNDFSAQTQHCHSGTQTTHDLEIPTGSRKELFCYINEVSFVVYETLLYLDTHPDDQKAMDFFHKHNLLRNHALKEYARLYGPLTISDANEFENQCWEWMNQPWPWEGGDC